MVQLGATLAIAGFIMELLLGRFRGFFDWDHIRRAPEPFKIVFSRLCLVTGAAILLVSALASFE